MRTPCRVPTALALAASTALLAGCPARDVRPDPAPEPAGPPPPTVEEQVDTLFDDWGVAGDVQDLMRTTLEFYATLQQLLPPDAHEVRELAAARLDSVIDAESLVDAAKAHVVAAADGARLGEVLAFNETEAGRKWSEAITRIKYDADDPDAWLAAFYGGLDDDPDAKARLARVRTLESVSGHGRMAIGMVLELAGLFLDGFAGLPDDIQPEPEHVAAVRANIEAAMAAPMMDELLLGSYLYATRDMTLEDIDAVIAFHVDGAGGWYAELLTGGMLAAAGSFVTALVDNLAGAHAELAS